MAQLFAGTSGFAYPQWKPRFYPQEVPQKKFLGHYAGRLNAVEINYTFRRTPSATTLASWVEATPEGFSFSIKAHQRITHIARLKDAREPAEFFLRSIEPLRAANRLGVVLFQLPPYLRCDVALLADFLAPLPGGLRYAFEFRHASWQDDAVYSVLEKHNACYCLAESEQIEPPDVITADFVYFRLRKPDYTPEDREAIWAKTKDLLAGGKSVFLFFKHEDTPDGALYAEEMIRKARE
jgi:uncharacterized protein YecE (DUF72 family)